MDAETYKMIMDLLYALSISEPYQVDNPYQSLQNYKNKADDILHCIEVGPEYE